MAMEYKGYTAGPIAVDIDDETGSATLSGTVANTKAVLHFQGSDGRELCRAFEETIDDYLTWCAERGQEPGKPYSGRTLLRVPPNLHRKTAMRAAEEGISLNSFVARILEEA